MIITVLLIALVVVVLLLAAYRGWIKAGREEAISDAKQLKTSAEKVAASVDAEVKKDTEKIKQGF